MIEPMPTPKTWRDRVVGALSLLSPKWKMEHEAAKVVTEELQSFRNSRYARTSGRTIAVEGRADYHLEVGYDRRELVDRARQLERNSVIAEGMLNRATENVIGGGFDLHMRTKNKTWNKDVEAKWKAWCSKGCDVRQLNTFGELLALTYRSWLRDGDVGAIKLSDGKLQFIESDQIANPMGNIPSRTHIDGVELDGRGAPKSFLIVKDPDPQWASVRFGQEFTNVPAKDMLFLARRQRIGQTRGLSAFSNCSWLLDQMDGMIEAKTIQARMAACVGLVISRSARASGLSTMSDSQGNQRRGMTIEPGMIAEIGQGDSVQVVDPKQGQDDFGGYIATLGRLVALSFGLPLEVAFLDFSRTNYSSARAALLQAHQIWELHQKMMGGFSTDVFHWWIMREMKAGSIAPRKDALKHNWTMPKWAWIDPDKELKAHLAAIDAGLDTHTRVAATQGRNFEDMQDIRKEEDDMKRARNLPITRSLMTRETVEPPLPAAPAEGKSQDKDPKGGKEGSKDKKEPAKDKGKK